MPKSIEKADLAVKLRQTVWVMRDEPNISAARRIAIDAMESLGYDESEWMIRDKIIIAIADRVNGMLSYVAKTS